jgi:hypothetical protein
MDLDRSWCRFFDFLFPLVSSAEAIAKDTVTVDNPSLQSVEAKPDCGKRYGTIRLSSRHPDVHPVWFAIHIS